MLGNYFYHARIRKAVASFGALFDNIYVLRTNTNGETISQVKVPLSYAPKRNFIERIRQTVNGEEAERLVAIKLPRMSFEMTSIAYDSTRQLNKMNSVNKSGSDSTKRAKFGQYVPYILTFDLNVYAKSQDDALQIVEQIIPLFSPKYNMTIKPFDDYPEVKEDVPLTLNSVTVEDSYEGAIEQRRTIVYTLSFNMNVNFYGEVGEGKIIRSTTTDFGVIGPNNTLVKYNRVITEPDPIDANPDDDYGFSVTFEDIT